jgi:hypothetical protein
MRRALILCVLVAGCEAETAGLLGAPGTADSGVSDAATPSDAGGAPDAGRAPDAGLPMTDAGTPTCSEVPQFSIDVRNPTGSYAGPARVVAVSPLRLNAQDQEFTVILSDDRPLTQRIRVGQQVMFSLQLHRPHWIEARISLRRIDATGQLPLIYAAWGGASFAEWTTPQASLHHEAGLCLLTEHRCGPLQEMNLVIDSQGGHVVVGRGQQTQLDDHTVFNGNSTRSPGGALCDDFPDAWYAGWIAGPPPPPTVACEQLTRDACIATPDCVLWGSQIYDPNYVCRPAADQCEAQTAETCGQQPSCSWEVGSCYCPENADCFCAGGPAPKCRTFCGGFGGGSCPSSHYCRMDLWQPPSCLPLPDAGGVCEWKPDDCEGTLSQPLCSCTQVGVTSLIDNDCLRRQAQGQGVAQPNECN